MYVRRRLAPDTADPRGYLLQAVMHINDALPDLRIVIDHLCKLDPAPQEQAAYDAVLREIAKRPNIYVELSPTTTPHGATPMTVRKFGIADAAFERSPGQDGDVFAGNVIDQRQGGPITIGYGRYGPDQSIEETLAVDDVMIVPEGRLSVSGDAGTVTAGPGGIVYMPKGDKVTIRAHDQGAVTAYVTYPHWQEARE